MVRLSLRVCMVICLVGNPVIAQGDVRQGIISGCDQMRIGQKVKMTGVVDDQFSDSCFLNAMSQVVWRLILSGTQQNPCTMSFTPKTGNCATVQSNSPDCACVSKVGTIWTFTLDFQYTERARGGELRIVPNCLPDSQYLNLVSCSNIRPNSPCEDYNCNQGVCYEQGSTAKCNCTDTYHTGTRCEVSPCAAKECQQGDCVVLSAVWPEEHTAACVSSIAGDEYCGLFECGNGCGCLAIWPIIVYSVLFGVCVVMIRTHFIKQQGKPFLAVLPQ